MDVLRLISSALGAKDDNANKLLAQEIVSNMDNDAINQLVVNLSNTDKHIQSDCIKTLYEISYVKPEIVVIHYQVFINLLLSNNNRLVWGGMIALSSLVDLKPYDIFDNLKVILLAIDNGSVITKDNGVMILAKLSKYSKISETSFPLLMEQLLKCPIKQLPMYCECSLVAVNELNKDKFIALIEKRLNECVTNSQKSRLLKILKKC